MRKRQARLQQDYRAAGMTLAQVHRSTSGGRTRATALLVTIALVLFAVAGTAGWLATHMPADGTATVAAPLASGPADAPTEAEVAEPQDEILADVAPPLLPDPEPAPLRVAALTPQPEPDPPRAATPTTPDVDLVLTAAADVEPDLCLDALMAMLASMRVSFGPSEVTAPAADMAAVFDLARRVNTCDGAHIIVAGHADSTGDEPSNLVLSWQRAEAVVTALADAGYNTTRFETIGYGSRRPAAEGSGEADEALNRRVDFALRRTTP